MNHPIKRSNQGGTKIETYIGEPENNIKDLTSKSHCRCNGLKNQEQALNKKYPVKHLYLSNPVRRDYFRPLLNPFKTFLTAQRQFQLDEAVCCFMLVKGRFGPKEEQLKINECKPLPDSLHRPFFEKCYAKPDNEVFKDTNRIITAMEDQSISLNKQENEKKNGTML